MLKKIKEIENDKVKINTFEPACCSTSTNSFCDTTEKVEIEQKEGEFELLDKIYDDPEKLHIDIYVPLDACACEWSQFMNLIFSAITPYIKHIKYETKSLNSQEARDMNLFSKCVIVDGKKKIMTSVALKRDLPRLLEEKGLGSKI